MAIRLVCRPLRFGLAGGHSRRLRSPIRAASRVPRHIGVSCARSVRERGHGRTSRSQYCRK